MVNVIGTSEKQYAFNNMKIGHYDNQYSLDLILVGHFLIIHVFVSHIKTFIEFVSGRDSDRYKQKIIIAKHYFFLIF